MISWGMKKRFLIIIMLLSAVFTLAGESIKVTTWNIEHLGTEGRGFGGGYGGSPVGGDSSGPDGQSA